MPRKKRFQRYVLLCAFIGLTLSVLVVSGGCKDDHDTNLTALVTTQDCGEFFCYTASQTTGITITVDFTRHHLAGQPFGTWFVEVEWRSADRQFTQELMLPVVIDAAGTGTAQIPADSLNAIFAQVNADQSLWDTQPGLRLSFYPDEETWEYYQFD